MYFYKNEIDRKICGLTTSPYKVVSENFFEITKEEFLALGGIIPKAKPRETSTESDSIEQLLDAIIA